MRQFSLSRKELDALGQTFASAGRTSLDLTRAKANNEVGNESVFCLAAPVAYHGSPTGGKCEKCSLYAFRNRSYLIHFEKQSIAGFSVNARPDSCGIGHEQVVAYLRHKKSASQ
jgi:hypothetical protein